MVQPPELNCIIQKFRFIYENLCGKGFIKPDFIKSYNSASRNSLHSILQYILIKAGIDCGYIPIPEYKVQFKKQIDKSKIDPRFEENAKRKKRKLRKQRQFSVDVAFFRNSKFEGLGEVYTLDEIHGCLPSQSLKNPWVTPYHKLTHLAKERNAKIKFLIILNVFPMTVKKEKLPWEDARRYSIREWKTLWKELAEKLEAEGLKTMLVGINECGIEVLHP